MSPLTHISPSPSGVTFSNLISQHGKTTPTVALSLNPFLLTLTSGEHSYIPYPFNSGTPISLKNFSLCCTDLPTVPPIPI